MVTLTLVYLDLELFLIILNLIKKISLNFVLKGMLIVLLLLSIKLGLKKFEGNLLIIKRYFFRFKTIMFIIGLVVAFMNFSVNFDSNNVSFAMQNDKGASPDPDLGGGNGGGNGGNGGDMGGNEDLRPNIEYNKLFISGLFIFAGLFCVGYGL
jgi:hypothetical protein